jgi:hypothetical protein
MNRSPVKALVTIVDRGRGAGLSAFLNKKYAQVSFVVMGQGTAGSDILDMLGIDSSDKDVLFSLADASVLPDLMNELSGRKFMRFSTKGIAFSIPINAIGSLLQAALVGSAQAQPLPAAPVPADSEAVTPAAGKEEPMSNPSYPYSLILVVAEKGHTEHIMQIARAAGATGGTILHARGVGHGEAEHFLGITLLSEKEIVAILAPAETKTAISRAINQNFGVRTDAQALVLSLPVEEMSQVN